MSKEHESFSLPSHYKLAFSAEAIDASVKRLGAFITPWAKEAREKTGQQVLAVCILRGGVFFFTDLLQEISETVEPAFCRTWSYSSVVNEQMNTGVKVSIEDIDATGRAVLLVDDICDTGSTLKKLNNVFTELGAREVCSAVLIHRLVEDSVFRPTWTAFEYPGGEWFVGYGMEDKNHYSNTSAVYTIVKQ